MSGARWKLVWLAVACLVLTVAGTALAATGYLTYRGCIANDPESGCAAPRHPSLGNNVGLAVSPDGQSVYVAAAEGTVTRLAPDPVTGDLVGKDCLADQGRHGCRDIPHDSLNSATGVAVSPDSASVYVTSAERTNAVTWFARSQTGKLSYRSCIANGGAHAGTRPCNQPPRNSLDSNEAIAISTDGTSVYVVSSGSDSITRFDRAPSGRLTYHGCFADDGAHGCRRPKHDSLGGAFDVAVTPDGKSVYVAALQDDAISRFNRRSNGALAYKGCIANDGAHGCRRPKHDALGGPDALAVSPDGQSLYVASVRAGSVMRFLRSPSGRLEPGGCFANWGAHGCKEPAENSLHAADGVAVSPDGQSLYVASMSGPTVNGGPGAVSWFVRRPDGSLGSIGCFADGGKHDCDPPPIESLGSPESVAVSPDGGSVYVGSYGRALSVFDRERAAP
jgi:DNA-binding beta-propeller fold protein YncE